MGKVFVKSKLLYLVSSILFETSGHTTHSAVSSSIHETLNFLKNDSPQCVIHSKTLDSSQCQVFVCCLAVGYEIFVSIMTMITTTRYPPSTLLPPPRLPDTMLCSLDMEKLDPSQIFGNYWDPWPVAASDIITGEKKYNELKLNLHLLTNWSTKPFVFLDCKYF